MKPRFSILTLLGTTAYIAVNVAAYAQPLGYWPFAAYILTIVLLLSLVAFAVAPGGTRSAFARGTLLAAMLLAHVQFFMPSKEMPYTLLATTTIDFNDPNRMQAEYNRDVLVSLNVYFALSVVGGCLTVWRHLAIERRAKEPPK